MHPFDPGEAIAAGLDLGTPERGVVVFLPGFMVAPGAYRSLLTPVADAGHRVVVPRLSRRGPRLASGRRSPHDEARDTAAVVAAVTTGDDPCVLGGHSRGGYVAWLAAAAVAADGLVLVDPVSGGGPPWARSTPPAPLPHPVPTLVLGAALGGRCAPPGRNHEQFAAAAPGAAHVIVPGCGHADVLDGADARLGRLACGGATDPTDARDRVAALVTAFVLDRDPRPTPRRPRS